MIRKCWIEIINQVYPAKEKYKKYIDGHYSAY